MASIDSRYFGSEGASGALPVAHSTAKSSISGTHSTAKSSILDTLGHVIYNSANSEVAANQQFAETYTIPAVQKAGAALSGAASAIGGVLNKQISPTDNNSGAAPIYSVSTGSSPSVNYLNADLAKAYGMDATTAYQEALSNTSYQRAVADLQAAGLNPVLAASGMSGAGGVYGASLSGTGVNVSSGASTAHAAYKSLSSIGAVIGGLVGAVTGKSVRSASFGASAGEKVFGAVGNLLDM